MEDITKSNLKKMLSISFPKWNQDCRQAHVNGSGVFESLRPLCVSSLCDRFFFGTRFARIQDIKTRSFTWLQFSAIHLRNNVPLMFGIREAKPHGIGDHTVHYCEDEQQKTEAK